VARRPEAVIPGRTVPGRAVLVATLCAIVLGACRSDPVVHCGVAARPIAEIQGDDRQSPLRDTTATAAGVVTRHLDDEPDGFLIQDGSADRRRSGGLFIADHDRPPTGHRVVARGRVVEIDGMTSLTDVRWADCGSTDLPQPVLWDVADDPIEAVEGMRVRIDDELTLTGQYRAGDGRLELADGDRLWQPTEHHRPGREAKAQQRANTRRSLEVRRNGRAPRLRSGDGVSDLMGHLVQRSGYALLIEGEPAYARRNPRPDVPPRDSTGIRVVAFNLLNYFNGNGAGGGFPTERGARDEAALARQQAKLVTAILALDADALALAELENDGFGPRSAVQQLVDAVNAAQSAGQNMGQNMDQSTGQSAGGGVRRYRAVTLERDRLGDQPITVGLLYDERTLQPRGDARTTLEPPFDALNRPPLAQTFEDARGHPMTLIAVHLKSKGCGDATGPEARQGDGQGCWNPTRTRAARALVDWVGTFADPAHSLILGDFNAYSSEDPIVATIAAGLTHLAEAGGYSFVYGGQAGTLDHAFAGSAVARRVVRVAHWSINADEPRWIDYRGSSSQADPYRSSDHDPLIIDLGD